MRACLRVCVCVRAWVCACVCERVRAHHVLDLGQGDLQGDVQGLVRVLHRPQGVGVVLHQVGEQLLGVAALGPLTH